MFYCLVILDEAGVERIDLVSVVDFNCLKNRPCYSKLSTLCMEKSTAAMRISRKSLEDSKPLLLEES